MEPEPFSGLWISFHAPSLELGHEILKQSRIIKPNANTFLCLPNANQLLAKTFSCDGGMDSVWVCVCVRTRWHAALVFSGEYKLTSDVSQVVKKRCSELWHLGCEKLSTSLGDDNTTSFLTLGTWTSKARGVQIKAFKMHVL